MDYSSETPKLENDLDRSSDIPPPVTADGLLNRIPPVKDRILVICLEKADCAGKWHKRRAILTSESLVLAREDNDYVREVVNLNLVEGIHIQHVAEANTSEDDLDRRDSGATSLQQNYVDMGKKLSAQEDINDVELKLTIRTSYRACSFSNIIGAENLDREGHIFDIIAKVEELQTVVRYPLRAKTKEDMESLLRALARQRERYIRSLPGVTMLKRLRASLSRFYDQYTAWGIMAGIILTNFIIDVVEAELQPPTPSTAASVFHGFEVLFTTLYSLDLAVNALSSSLLPFLRKGWNLLDLTIISLSIASLALNDASGINSLRTIRAIRAVRLLKGVERLRDIVNAVLSSVRRGSVWGRRNGIDRCGPGVRGGERVLAVENYREMRAGDSISRREPRVGGTRMEGETARQSGQGTEGQWKRRPRRQKQPERERIMGKRPDPVGRR